VRERRGSYNEVVSLHLLDNNKGRTWQCHSPHWVNVNLCLYFIVYLLCFVSAGVSKGKVTHRRGFLVRAGAIF
jgi:hypothetical protein